MEKSKLSWAGFVAILAGFFVVIVLGAGGYLWWTQKPPRQSVGPPEKITIANASQPIGGLVYIAVAKGYFENEGLDVTLRPHTSGKDALATMLVGKANLAMTAETPIMHAVLKGEQLYTIATIGTSGENIAVVGRIDKGISMPAALKGKKIGVSLGTNGEFFLEVFLIIQEILRSEVDIVNLDPVEMFDALVKGEVDAVSTWEPHVGRLQKKLADNGISFYGKEIYKFTWNLAGKRAFIEKNPETIKKVLRAINKAAIFTRKNPDDSRKILADQFRILGANFDKVWDKLDLSVSLDQAFLLSLEDQARWAIKNKYTDITEVPNFLDALYLDGLEAVNREAVTVFR